MLTKLHIKNFLVIEDVTLNFASGLTVLTGETGGGKSILIDALMVIFSPKATVSMIRTNELQAELIAEFMVNRPDIIDYLQQYNFINNVDINKIICKKVIPQDGKIKNYINGFTVSNAKLKQLGGFLFDVHTQHATLALLNPNIQQKLFDEFVGIAEEVSQISKSHKEIVKLERDIKIFVSENDIYQRELSRLKSEAQELSDLNLTQNEWLEIVESHHIASNSNVILKEIAGIVNVLDNNEKPLKSIIDKLIMQVDKLNNIFPKCDNVLILLKSVAVELEEISREANHLSGFIDDNPNLLENLEQRMNDIFNVARKFKIIPEEILLHLDGISLRIDNITVTRNIENLENQLLFHVKQYKKLATHVTNVRTKTAPLLEQKVQEILHILGIVGHFEVYFKSNNDEISPHGHEAVEYKISFNRGMKTQPLSKVASGGELSRVALSLYLLLNDTHSPDIIIFDEIDVGVGGKIAAMIGKLLKNLSNKKQIICITHQPQTASYGDNHLSVYKKLHNNVTTVFVDALSNDTRVHEVARMLSGAELTELTVQHARELLDRARERD